MIIFMVLFIVQKKENMKINKKQIEMFCNKEQLLQLFQLLIAKKN